MVEAQPSQAFEEAPTVNSVKHVLSVCVCVCVCVLLKVAGNSWNRLFCFLCLNNLLMFVFFA